MFPFFMKSTTKISVSPEIFLKHFLFPEIHKMSSPKENATMFELRNPFLHLIGGEILEAQAALVGIGGAGTLHWSGREMVFLLSLSARNLQVHLFKC